MPVRRRNEQRRTAKAFMESLVAKWRRNRRRTARGRKGKMEVRKGKMGDMDEIAKAIARRRFECDIDLLSEEERSEIYDEAFDGLCELQRHNC